MKKAIILLAVFLSLTTIIAEEPLEINLIKGKNNLTIYENFYSIYASQLIERYPEIESITLFEYGNNFGYVNVFGGVGTNFFFEPTKKYEITTNKNITLYLR